MKFRKLSEIKEAFQKELEKDCDDVADREWKYAQIEEIFDKAVEDTAYRDGLIDKPPKKEYHRPEDEWL